VRQASNLSLVNMPRVKNHLVLPSISYDFSIGSVNRDSPAAKRMLSNSPVSRSLLSPFSVKKLPEIREKGFHKINNRYGELLNASKRIKGLAQPSPPRDLTKSRNL
jgi:hypothetical protein